MIYWKSVVPQHVSGILTPIIRRSDCVTLPMVFCPVVAVEMLESRVAKCVHCEEEAAYTTATTGQKTIGSVTQSDLQMMGVKTPETC